MKDKLGCESVDIKAYYETKVGVKSSHPHSAITLAIATTAKVRFVARHIYVISFLKNFGTCI